jgi:hypothetical protein
VSDDNHEEQDVLHAHASGAVAVVFLDSERLAIGGRGGRVKIFDAKGELQKALEAAGPMRALATDGRGLLAAGGDRGVVRFWNADDGKLRHEFASGKGSVTGLAFNKLGTRLAVADAKGGVAMWQSSQPPSKKAWHQIFTLEGHKGGAHGVTFLGPKKWMPKENSKKRLDWVVTGGADHFVQVWDVDDHSRRLVNGRITHGMQYSNPDWAEMPTSYYGGQSGIGITLASRREKGRGQRVGVVGLGTGSAAVYAKKGDDYLFYDINPEVERVAEEEFSYLRDARRRGAKMEIVLGDARLSMEQEKPHGFDVLVLDAFSSDAIPVHLLTREALKIYERHMDKNGVIAVHISNRHLKLEGVTLRLAEELGWKTARIYGGKSDEDGDERHYLYYSEWILLTRNEDFLKLKKVKRFQETARSTKPRVLWTDDHVSIFPIVESPDWWQNLKAWPNRLRRWWRQ